MILERRVRKKIERAFYNYDVLKKSGVDYVSDWAEQTLTPSYARIGDSKQGYEPSPRGSAVSNPTEAVATKAADKQLEAYKWCRVVEKTKERFMYDDNKGELIRLRYKKKCSFNGLQIELYISEMTLCNWLEEILAYAAMLAIQYGLIVIDKDYK